MEGMLWGVAAMCVKDAVKQPYLKGRDYERNVRQVYRDVDNLGIAVAHVRSNCQGDDMPDGAQALFIRRAERQLRDAYRTLRRDYPRRLGLSGLVEYSTTPGGEMHLLDIGKEANQTAKGLGDLLAEIRFAKLGKKPKEEEQDAEEKKKKAAAQKQEDEEEEEEAAPRPRSRRRRQFPPPPIGVARNRESAVSDDSSSDQASISDPSLAGSWRSPPSPLLTSTSTSTSTSDRSSRKRPKAARKRSYSASDHPAARDRLLLLPPASSSSSRGRRRDHDHDQRDDRERALDNLQHSVDRVLAAIDDEATDETEAMAHLQRSLVAVLRVQKSPRGFAGSSDAALGDAVEDLDDALSALAAAATERDRDHALKRVTRAFEDVDAALARRRRRRQRDRDRELRRAKDGQQGQQQQQLTAGSPVPSDGSSSSSSRGGPRMHGGSFKWKQGSRERGGRRYSVH